MAATIDYFWQIDYNNKRIYYENNNPSDNDFVWSVNALYSYLQDVFDNLDQMDDYTPMSAQTPTAYTLTNGWFIDDESMKFLSGGAITQANNSPDSLDILFIQSSSTAWTPFVSTDIGLTVTQTTTGDTRYFPAAAAANTGTAGTTVTITLVVDGIAS